MKPLYVNWDSYDRLKLVWQKRYFGLMTIACNTKYDFDYRMRALRLAVKLNSRFKRIEIIGINL